MTKDEAFKLALEALIDLGADDYEGFGDVLDALEEALANDALEKKAENARELGLDYKPEPYKVISDHITQTTGGRSYIDPVTGNVSIGTVPQPSISVEQEPVAWLNEEKKIIYWHNTHETDDYHGFKRTTPLYTSPPQRKPLTDEEIWEALSGIDCTRPMLIARAIEAAHGITGEKNGTR